MRAISKSQLKVATRKKAVTVEDVQEVADHYGLQLDEWAIQELVKDNQTPILGVNLGHVGFLAEIEKPSINEVVDAIVNKDYKTENRMILNFKLLNVCKP